MSPSASCAAPAGPSVHIGSLPAMASDEPGAAPSSDPCLWALFCSSCDMWINGSEQFLEHKAGKKHC
eukprot:1372203-Lingulodinium_polyedra.AAC.1